VAQVHDRYRMMMMIMMMMMTMMMMMMIIYILIVSLRNKIKLTLLKWGEFAQLFLMKY
jgi:hypothetical protein